MHKQTHICIAFIKIYKSEITFSFKICKFSILGFLGNFNLSEMSNYPNTIHSDLNYKKIEPNEIFGVGSNSESLMKLSVISYDDSSPFVKESVTTVVDLEISPVKFSFYQQVFFRIFDYFLIQILALILNPEYLSLNAEFYSSKNSNDDIYIPKRVVGLYEDILKRLKFPNFMRLKVK